MLKLFKIAIIGIIVIISVVIIKYKPAYQVTLSGETLGFITEKEIVENNIENYKNNNEGCISFVEIKDMPIYEFKLVNRNTNTVENEVFAKVKEQSIITYKTYAITLDGEEKFQVNSEEEAEKIVSQIKEGVSEEINLNLGIIEKYSNELNITAEETVIASLNETKKTKVDEYNAKKAAEEAKKLKEQQLARAAATKVNAQVSSYLGNLGLSRPVSGIVTSRYGSRSSGFHTGLDIATSAGTGICPIASGTVTYASSKGSYGNLIIINHGDGIESYYAHCSAIYVSVGQSVNNSTLIGAVGSTGNSTGPHLHLEIRLNGTTINPQNYLY
ncbi:MAG: M23 family metallopeptidase [Candidatus Scatovivens sp.]